MPEQKYYLIKGKRFFRKDPTLAEEQQLNKIISKIKSPYPVQIDFAKEMVAVVGGFVSSIVASGYTWKILFLALNPEKESFLLKHSPGIIRKYYYKKFFTGNIKSTLVKEVLTDFFTDTSLSSITLINHLMTLLIDRTASIVESAQNFQDSGSRNQNAMKQTQ